MSDPSVTDQTSRREKGAELDLDELGAVSGGSPSKADQTASFFQVLSNIIKSASDTSKAIISNIR